METVRLCGVATATALLWSCAGTPVVVRVQPEESAVLDVGEIAAVPMPSEDLYVIGSAGRLLVLIKQTQQQGMTSACIAQVTASAPLPSRPTCHAESRSSGTTGFSSRSTRCHSTVYSSRSLR